MKGSWEHAAGNMSDIRHDWHCIKDETGKQIACSSFILDLQEETSRYRVRAFSHARQDLWMGHKGGKTTKLGTNAC